PVATVGLDGAHNAGILAVQILATGDPEVMKKMEAFKAGLEKKIIKANEELKEVTYKYKVN
ncbi:MAG: AIR carboxylase family protein, partial [Bacteroidota bacterium]